MALKPEAALLIHYYFPPIHSIGVLRNFYLAQAFQKKIEHIQVLTTSNRNILPQNNMKGLESFTITPLETKDYRTHQKQTHFQESKKNKWTIKFVRKLIDSFPFNVWIGEGGSSYINNGIKEGSKFLSKNHNSLIYTSFRPYADLYIGYKLKQAFPDAKWIVDFRDLHVDPMYKNVFFPSLQKRNNNRIIKSADLIITVSEGLAKELRKTHAQVKTVYNGININKKQTEKFEKFTICYTGSLFGNKRNPKPFFSWLNEQIAKGTIEKNNIEIKYAGKDGPQFYNYIKEFNLETNFENLGIISHHKAKLLQKQSHINLLLTNVTKNHKGVLTGKLFEYIGSLTPIVAVINGGHDDELELLLKKTNSGIVFSLNNENEVHSLYQNWLNGNLIINNDSNIEKYFSWDSAAKEILEAINV